mmetsp:Transcript_26159/g.73174  ORF Transcript_26159/g.73174 Transcript_26159/m.73174 type:complete len:502 (+) Transcript_26159:141-1646(+)|eukprot:CAMPEP_0119141914 /NCGR_PEP_ID=MMETSP1310-20130426/31777_1 /TAXON_ID=464262 /ORGANISM="Genus nov. species nov., Strain RCC2339" /LENGTH=501 /DNA_ID=CAMNT_0007133407 /DNA_START=94 /DNA_END=1599 /DNA_ORIENTATION=+
MWTVVAASVVVAVSLVFWLTRKSSNNLPKEVKRDGPFKGVPLKQDGDIECSDLLIVGAGPAGSTMAYYMMKKNPKLRVKLVDRATFPRKKYCGDAWCAPALDILEEMGVLADLEKGETDLPVKQEYVPGKPLCRAVQRGGFVSPAGFECIGGPYGSSINIRTYAIKRYIVDEFIARRAEKEGAELIEGCEITDAKFNEKDSLWELYTTGGLSFRTRLLAICDGSNSYLGQKLKYVQGPADSVCSHQYIIVPEDKRDDFDADGVMFFSASLLPGYSAIFKHYNGDIYLGTYILPGGDATSRWIKPFEDRFVRSYEYVRRALGGEERKYRETKKTAPIRTGGIAKSYGPHLLFVGDSAGLVDPLTGEGIHTAMIAAKLAAETSLEMFEHGDFSEGSTAVYQRRWMEAFGDDFWWSAVMAKALRLCPIAVDAMAVVGKRKGQAFLDEFGEMMTGVRSKVGFLSPHLSVPLGAEVVRQIFLQFVMGQKPTVPDCGSDLKTKYSGL